MPSQQAAPPSAEAECGHPGNAHSASIEKIEDQGTRKPVHGLACGRSGLPRSEMEALLGAFLVGTEGAELSKRLVDLSDLPLACRGLVEQAGVVGRIWAAWSTTDGPMAAWGDYDRKRSEQMHAHVMYVEWWSAERGHHSLWAYCYPRRPTEWIAGRGRA